MLFMKRPKPKKFDYQPRYYDPSKDKDEIRKRRLGFRSNFRESTKKKSPLLYILLLFIILYIILWFEGVIQ